jgi:mono/diheme cytochrome c family protein
MRRTLAIAAVLVALAAVAAALAAPTAPSFAKDVAPILAARCIGCHGAAAGLSLESYAALRAGANGKPVVVPGDPGASRLVKLVDGRGQPRMPYGEDPLPAAQIEKIKAWIAAGAKND